MNVQSVAGVDLPLASIQIQPSRYEFAYVKPPTNSLDWAGVDWPYPTALEFQTQVMTKRTISHRARVVDEPKRAEQLLMEIQHIFERGARAAGFMLANSNMVLESPQGLQAKITTDPTPFPMVQVEFRAGAWPAVEGVTIPAPDTTL